MLPRKPPGVLSTLRAASGASEYSQPEDHDDQRDQEHKNGNAVDAMHVSHPFGIRLIRIPFPQVEIFSQLFENSHYTKLIKTNAQQAL